MHLHDPLEEFSPLIPSHPFPSFLLLISEHYHLCLILVSSTYLFHISTSTSITRNDPHIIGHRVSRRYLLSSSCFPRLFIPISCYVQNGVIPRWFYLVFFFFFLQLSIPSFFLPFSFFSLFSLSHLDVVSPLPVSP